MMGKANDFLAGDDKGSRLYASAFVAHTRDLIDESPVYGATSIKWSMHLVRERRLFNL